MADETVTLAAVYAGWEADQQRLASLIGALTREQLALRAASHLRTVSAGIPHRRRSRPHVALDTARRG